ncbi:MAG: hypothetical protein CVT62_12410 [Actinobacteria bacterium HGW-Actinobacteria-2]|nr:MAG: hypothetical protein CVT62_12410 [Actinobacteria bacterium HGW-Actinobacteria-2]
MARKKKDPTPKAAEPTVDTPASEDTELAELAELAGEQVTDPTPSEQAADDKTPADVEPDDATPDASDGAGEDEPTAEDPDEETPADDAAPTEADDPAEDDESAEDEALSEDDEPVEDETVEGDEPVEEVEPVGDEPDEDDEPDAGDVSDEDDEPLTDLDDADDDAVLAALDPQASFDDDLDLPWSDEDELADDSASAAAYAPIPVSPSSPADTTYPPPPPYDPNVLPKATRRSARSAAAAEVTAPGGGADYMLADAMNTPPKKAKHTPLLVGAAVLVLALIGGIIWAAPSLFPGMFAPPRTATPKGAVEAYLSALASGDSATALKAAVAPPTDTTLLTDEVLKSSQQRAPITDIVVKDASGSTSAIVPVTYSIGGKPVTASFPTQKVGNEWRLVTITRDVQLSGIDYVSVTLNGTPVTKADHLTLFPGSYVLASANDRLAVSGGEFVVQSPSDFANPTLSATISDKGMAEARTAAQAFLTACVKKKEMVPSGCGFGVSSSGVKVKSVTWRVTSGAKALKTAIFKTEASQPYVATVYPYIQLEATVFDASGRRYTGPAVITVAKADLSGSDVVVTFNH